MYVCCLLKPCIKVVSREACTHRVSTCLAMTDVMDFLEIIQMGMQDIKMKMANPVKILNFHI